jgi:hypothetical protein
MTLATVLVSLGTELAPLATVFPSPAETGIHVYLHIFIFLLLNVCFKYEWVLILLCLPFDQTKLKSMTRLLLKI